MCEETKHDLRRNTLHLESLIDTLFSTISIIIQVGWEQGRRSNGNNKIYFSGLCNPRIRVKTGVFKIIKFAYLYIFVCYTYAFRIV